jgi:hypothetical protein
VLRRCRPPRSGGIGAAEDPERPVTMEIDGYLIGLSKRSFQVA